MTYNFNSNKMFFLFILFFSTLISISSNSWLGCWIGLEINLLSFIPLISNVNNLLSSEASLKYFLTQSIASINLLFIILIKMIMFKTNEFNNMFSISLNLTLLMKMGSAPFHFWFPNIMEGLSWMNCFILMTWQKITPMILISYYYNMKFLIFIMIMNIIVSVIGGMNQTSLRKLLTFSSINNISWMIMSLLISENLWLTYFLIYFFLNFLMCFMLMYFNIFFFNQMFFCNLKQSTKMYLFLNLLSLGGLPPFLGFFPKWIVLNFMMLNNYILMSFMFIMGSLMMLFFYIRITYSSFLFNYLKLKWFKIKNKNNFFYILNFVYPLSLIGIPLSTFFFFF